LNQTAFGASPTAHSVPQSQIDNSTFTIRALARAVGGTRLELVTSTMSTWRSNQLS
jgi:hypothetical protein